MGCEGLEHLEVEFGRLSLLFTYLDGYKCVKDGVIQSITVSNIKLRR